jgi:hypothetical protein
MPTFRRIKLQATVETEAMLLPENEIDGALGELRDKLKQLDLTILSVEPTEPPPLEPSEPSDDDPWSVRGQPVE